MSNKQLLKIIVNMIRDLVSTLLDYTDNSEYFEVEMKSKSYSVTIKYDKDTDFGNKITIRKMGD